MDFWERACGAFFAFAFFGRSFGNWYDQTGRVDFVGEETKMKKRRYLDSFHSRLGFGMTTALLIGELASGRVLIDALLESSKTLSPPLRL